MVVIDPGYCGPSFSGNGGYTSGLVAEEFGSLAQVTLTSPPPLGVELHFERSDVLGLFGPDGVQIAIAREGHLDSNPAPYVDPELVRSKEPEFPGGPHPFPRCFTCGTDRAESEGLRIRSAVISEGIAAGIFTPHPAFFVNGALPIPVMWAAMDCPGYWAVGYQSQPAVLGRMTAEVLRTVQENEHYISVGQVLAKEGRKIHSRTAIYDFEQTLIARSEQTWIEINPHDFEPQG